MRCASMSMSGHRLYLRSTDHILSINIYFDFLRVCVQALSSSFWFMLSHYFRVVYYLKCTVCTTFKSQEVKCTIVFTMQCQNSTTHLFHRYMISDLINWKQVSWFLSNYWVRDFLTYSLELSPTMCIHSVVSIAQLESAFKNNSYNCEINVNLSSVKNNNDDDDVETVSSYEIEQLLDKCTIHWEHREFMVEYFVKWKKYNHSYNT